MNNTDFEENRPIEPGYDNSDQLTELQKDLISAIEANEYERIQALIETIPAEQTDFYWFRYDSASHPLTSLMRQHEMSCQEKSSMDRMPLIKNLLNKTPAFTTSDQLYPRLFRKNNSDRSTTIIGEHPFNICLHIEEFYCLFKIMIEKVSSQAVLAGGVITSLNHSVPDNMLHQILDKIDNYDINLDFHGLQVAIDDEFREGTIKQVLFYYDKWDTILRMVNMGHPFAGYIDGDEGALIPMIWFAALRHRWDVVEEILTIDTANVELNVDIKAPSLSEFAAMVGQDNILAKMTQLNISFPKQAFTTQYLSGYTFFMCLVGMFDKVIDSLNAGFDPNATVAAGPMQGYNLIRLATCTLVPNDEDELYDFLALCIEKKLDLDNYLTAGELAGTNTLWDALSEDRWDLAEYLLEHGACPCAVLYEDGSVESSCHLAARGKQWELCKKLIIKGANPDIFDESGNGAYKHVLFQAISDDNFDMVNFLIQHRANLNLVSKYKYGPSTALHACVLNVTNFKLFVHLLKNGANPNLSHNQTILSCIFNSNMPDKHIWALEAIKYGADLSNSSDNLNVFHIMHQHNTVYAAMSLLYFFARHPRNQLNYLTLLSAEEKSFYEKIQVVFNLFIKLPFFDYQRLNNICQTKLQMASNLPFELRVQIICLWLTHHLKSNLAGILPISAASMPMWLEASGNIISILDGSDLVTISALQTTKVFNVIFARLVTAMRNNRHLIYRTDAESMSKYKKFWNGVLFKQFCEVVQEHGLDQDLSYVERQKMSYRVENYKSNKSARVNDYRADFTWLFRLGMYGVEPSHTNQLLKEAKLNKEIIRSLLLVG
jgi:hypothetical protein